MKMLLIPKISYFKVGSQKVCPKIDLATNHMTSERLTSKCNKKAIVGKMYTESLQPKLSLINPVILVLDSDVSFPLIINYN